MAKPDPKRCAELLAALAAPERLGIVRLLANGPRNVTQITKALKIAPLNVSHHLSTLKHAGIISNEKKGRFVIYSLCDGVLCEAVAAGVPQDALDLGCCQLVFCEKSSITGSASRMATQRSRPS